MESNKIVEGILNCDFSDPIFTFIKTNEIEFRFNTSISWSLDGEEKKTERSIKIKNIQRRIRFIK